MYKVKVQGLYIARSPHSEKEKIKKPYEIEGKIPTLRAALSIVKNKLLAPALSKKYEDYVSPLTYNIVQIVPLNKTAEEAMGRAEVMYMDRPSLIRYIKDNALPVQEQYFPDLFKLREAVQGAKEDPEGFLRRFELRKEDLELDLAMQQANPELFADTPTEDFVATVAIQSGAPKKKALPKAQHRDQTESRLKGFQAEQERDGELAPLDADADDDEGL